MARVHHNRKDPFISFKSNRLKVGIVTQNENDNGDDIKLFNRPDQNHESVHSRKLTPRSKRFLQFWPYLSGAKPTRMKQGVAFQPDPIIDEYLDSRINYPRLINIVMQIFNSWK